MQLLIFGSGSDVFEGRENSRSLHLSPPLLWEPLCYALCRPPEINSWE